MITVAPVAPAAPSLARGPAGVLTFDVEEWFQTENLRRVCPRAAWDRLPRRAPEATRRVLDFLAARDLRATFFVLGLVAEQHPDLVRAIAEEGHEVACHGYGHVLPSQLTAMEFRDDVLRARKLLQDLSGQPVPGYRAPSFCLERSHLAILAGCGFEYDSSYHPVRLHDRYARFDWLGPALRPGIYPTGEGLVELALPVERVGPIELSAAGGGYFRLYPGWLFRRLALRALARDGHHVLYLHTWECDPDQPRVRAGASATFRHYHNLARTLPRLGRLVDTLRASSAHFVTAHRLVTGAAPA